MEEADSEAVMAWRPGEHSVSKSKARPAELAKNFELVRLGVTNSFAHHAWSIDRSLPDVCTAAFSHIVGCC